MIPVTKPTLCDLEEFCYELADSWQSGVLTHHGPKVQKFESEISKLSGLVPSVSVTNGTVALQLALRTLSKKGEVILPSFTWIASASAIEYEGFVPVFCDIDPNTLNIDVVKLEEAITENTVAIMPVHVFGQPCDIDTINGIANKHRIEVIYDAAHAFGSKYKGRSIFDHDHTSCVSFHATKILNCGEGGAIFNKQSYKRQLLESFRFFGYSKEKEPTNSGTNGKLTEIHAALGLCNLRKFPEILLRRKMINDLYRHNLSDVSEISFQSVDTSETNFSYFPIIFKTEKQLLLSVDKLNQNQIYPRRYFHPSLSTIERFKAQAKQTPISNDISNRILCLPCYNELTEKEISKVCNVIKDAILDIH